MNLLGKSMNSDAELAQLDRDAAAKAKQEAASAQETAARDEAEDETEEDSVVWNTGSRTAKKKTEESVDEPARPWVSFWRPNVTLNLVEDHNA